MKPRSKLEPAVLELANAIGATIADHLLGRINSAPAIILPEYLTVQQVTQMTGFSAKALENMRSRREGAPFIKVGTSVRYRIDDVRAWIERGGQP